MNDDTPRNNMSYQDACHAMQSGVLTEQRHRVITQASAQEAPDSPKHLRVGVNSCLVTIAALARLLVKKGLITQAEYAEEVRLEMNREVDRYEDRISEAIGRRVTLA